MSEFEIPILILSLDIRLVIEKIINLLKLKRYIVIEKGIENIHDIYYDTKDNLLLNKNSNLRIRTIDNRDTKITFKRLKDKRENYFNRIEIENSWSYQMFSDIMNELNVIDIQFNDFKKQYQHDPKQTFNNLGLITPLIKKTNRTILNAVDKTTNQIEFEVAFDHVILDVTSEKSICFFELEIESKRKGNEDEIDKVVNDLITGSEFRRWAYNKLETGIAIIFLYKNKILKASEDYDGKDILTKRGFEKIESFLKNS